MTKGRKNEIITFKVDEALADALQGVPNRSEFIRSAILAALDNVCPLCMGTGILSANQKRHWREFAATHSLQECDDCHELYLTCGTEPADGPDTEPAPTAAR